MFAARPCSVPGKGRHVCRGAALAARKACFGAATALSGCAAAAVLQDVTSMRQRQPLALRLWACLSAVTLLCAQL